MPSRGWRRRRRHWGYWHHGGHWYHPYAPVVPPPPPWWGERPSVEDEKEELQEYIAFLKEELQAAEEGMKELEREE